MNKPPSNNSHHHPIDDSGNGSRSPLPAPESVEIVESLEIVESGEVSEARQAQIRATQRSFQRLYLILLVIGLAIGGVVSIGVAALLDRFGLSHPPAQIEKPKSHESTLTLKL